MTWLGKTPLGWRRLRLKRCFTDIQNGIWGEEPDGVTNVIVVRVADFDRINLRVCLDEPTFRSITPDEFKSRKLTRGDLLIEKSGGGDQQPVGVVVSFDHTSDSVCSNFVARLQVSNTCSPRYLVFLNAMLYMARINLRSIKQTTGIQNLDSDSYFDELVDLPPLATQEGLAEYLDEETTRIHALIAERSGRLNYWPRSERLSLPKLSLVALLRQLD